MSYSYFLVFWILLYVELLIDPVFKIFFYYHKDLFTHKDINTYKSDVV